MNVAWFCRDDKYVQANENVVIIMNKRAKIYARKNELGCYCGCGWKSGIYKLGIVTSYIPIN